MKIREHEDIQNPTRQDVIDWIRSTGWLDSGRSKVMLKVQQVRLLMDDD